MIKIVTNIFNFENVSWLNLIHWLNLNVFNRRSASNNKLFCTVKPTSNRYMWTHQPLISHHYPILSSYAHITPQGSKAKSSDFPDSYANPVVNLILQ